ncbi:MAG: cobalamin-dependent protein [Thermofilaceae archaeon]|nr:cobalamin-dependent protein [Thermofilaceae archaeon]MCX8180989.1 cobalamin-dependent protein [Thermofilaceae archaeon]MDW8004094.1 cobalamin-dependent protein [Thermofilaceae archaeon]
MAEAIYEYASSFRPFDVEREVRRLVSEGVDPKLILELLRKALLNAYQLYRQGVYGLPHLSAMVTTFHMALEAMGDKFHPSENAPKVLMGTLGSIHYIGKDIIKCFYIAEGFNVLDLGENLLAEDFIKGIEFFKPHVVALSIFLTNVLNELEKIVSFLEEKELRREVKIIIGGAVANEHIARKYRVDGWGRDPGEAVKLVYEMLEKIGGEK